MKTSEKVSLDLVESAGAIIIWTFFVFLLFNRGFQENYSPIQLGVVSLLFSGTMALLNGIIPNCIKAGKEKAYLVLALILEMIACVLLFSTHGFFLILFIVIVEAACYSIITESKKALLERKNQHHSTDFIFKLFRMLGPVLGGIVILVFPPLMAIVYILLIGIAGIAITIRVDSVRAERATGKVSGEWADRNDEKFKESRTYLSQFLVVVALITFSIQVVDAQLITVFHRVDAVNALVVGCCIGCSGVGVFVISIFLEKYISKLDYFFVSVLLMGVILTVTGIYIGLPGKVGFFPLIPLFFCGGIFWQTVMTFLENVIKSVRDETIKNHYFQSVGIIILVTYSLGAFSSGFLVQLFTIKNVYVFLGLLLFVVSICPFIYIKWKQGGKSGTTNTS